MGNFPIAHCHWQHNTLIIYTQTNNNDIKTMLFRGDKDINNNNVLKIMSTNNWQIINEQFNLWQLGCDSAKTT